MERQLITDYVALVDEILAGLNSHNYALAVQLAELPDQIRGFGHVKERNLKDVKEREATLLAAFRNPDEVQAAAE
jgi:indolepyruvate ferredoxin oxidoreductase